ncbi:MAG: NHLP family bacteriocin export ABC transporter peptidase/permease/ATPase subunit [Oscillospiraceae bacterium]|jgi:NHLM bacteriocin system ABC transporter peptidase/ATP-binding protein|nr:NHLP family bacteriocin export ABC transporter peptidase/permease/ATPase subunit [Oscillospiraceae bacterium]MBQ5490187.1 NHLP family bacteriocin export ABC transporter peptidase/permease/ATPase subunit [Oscillospiraceae bacterium]
MAKNTKNIKQPVRNGRAKVPVVMQMEALECGAACLAMVMAYYGKWVPLEQVRYDCGVSRDGSNAKNVLVAARNYGFDAQGFRCEISSLKENMDLPCIIHWNFNHFVVLDGFRGNYAYLNDPARGEVKVSMEEFDQAFTGICLQIKPGEEFVPGGKPKSTLEFARKRLAGAGVAVLFVLLSTIIGYLFGIVNPVFARFFMDRLLTGENRELLMPFIGLLALMGAAQIVVALVQAVYSLKINGKMAIVGNSTYMWKVLRMPMEFFSQRMSGDILQRQSTNASIASVLINTLTPLALNTIMMIFYLVVMIRYSAILTAVGIITIILNLFVSRFISAKRVNITRVSMRDSGKLAAATVSGIEMVETIKASGAENGFFQKWAGYQASVNAQNVKYAKLNQYLGVIPTLLSAIADSAVLVLGVWLAMRGEFTPGMIMTFQGFLSSFMSPAMTLISASQTIQEMRTEMERVEDVMQYPSDTCFSDEPLKEDADYSKLSGTIELKNVTFGYSRLGEPLIRDFSMSMKPGSRVAFVGASGCGKSTLAKLISGLYQPWSGEILFDGKHISEIDRSVFKGSVAVVDQDITLFKDTIANNIKMWDDSIEDFEMILAARDAQIYDDIMARDGGFYGKLTEGGKDLSGGQRQRIEIARVLAQDPSVIIMDEATSALDAKTEYELVKAVKDRGITCIVIAHRLSTIRDCDEIIVLNKGLVVERGTHDELYSKGGYYTELIASD